MTKTFEALRDELLRNPEVALAYRELAPPVLLGARIAARRADLRLSQMELAERAGITQRQVSAIERGRIDARISTISKIGHALDLELELSYPRPQLCMGETVRRLTVQTASARARVGFPGTLPRQMAGTARRQFAFGGERRSIV